MNTGINEEINTKDIVNLFRLTYQTVEDIRETHTEQDLGIVPLIINSGAFNRLTYKENLFVRELCIQLLKNYSFMVWKDWLNPTQVYYFIKDGLNMGSFLLSSEEDNIFNQVYDKSMQYGGDLYKQQWVERTLYYTKYFIGEELHYLLTLQATKRITNLQFERYPDKLSNMHWYTYRREITIPLNNKYGRFHYLVKGNTVRLSLDEADLDKRDIFHEFETGLIPNNTGIQLPTLKVDKE